MKKLPMNKLISGLVLLLWVFILALPAHAPKSIKVNFNRDIHELKVTIRHPVKNVSRHYVKRIRILVNGQKVVDTRYKKQTSPEIQSAQFKLKGIKTGDTILIKATCNRFGGKKAKKTVK